jgi:hypothetical protein
LCKHGHPLDVGVHYRFEDVANQVHVTAYRISFRLDRLFFFVFVVEQRIGVKQDVLGDGDVIFEDVCY